MAKSQPPVLVDPVYSSVITLLIIVMACVELYDAATVVDVYRLVQYDLAGVPFGSRLAGVNHHAGSSLFSSAAASSSAADLSITVLILPVHELNLTFIKEYIGQKKPLGGLLLLLPPVFNPQNLDSGGRSVHVSAKDIMKEVLRELEQLLIHANILWLRSLDQRLRETIDYSICLNSIGSVSNELWIHASKPPDNIYIKQIFEVAWEHEHFSRLRVTAATLSELSVAPDFLESTGGLSDSRYFVDEASISRSVKLVAESRAVSVQHEVLDVMFTFYDSTSGRLHIYQVASVTFGLLLLLTLGSYFITLFSFFGYHNKGS